MRVRDHLAFDSFNHFSTKPSTIQFPCRSNENSYYPSYDYPKILYIRYVPFILT